MTVDSLYIQYISISQNWGQDQIVSLSQTCSHMQKNQQANVKKFMQEHHLGIRDESRQGM